MSIRVLKAALAGLVLCASGFASAGLMTFTFEIEAEESLATGSFTGDDLDLDGFFDASEITTFMVSTTGTPFIGGSYNIDASEAILLSFEFNISGNDLLTFNARNSASNPFKGVWLQSNRRVLYYETSRGSFRDLSSIKVMKVDVPEPSTLAIFALGMIGLVSNRFRR